MYNFNANELKIPINYLRKKILDIGNETIRDIEKNFDFIKMEFKDENEK